MTETRRGFIVKTIAFLAAPFVAKKAACDHNIQRYFSGTIRQDLKKSDFISRQTWPRVGLQNNLETHTNPH